MVAPARASGNGPPSARKCARAAGTRGTRPGRRCGTEVSDDTTLEVMLSWSASRPWGRPSCRRCRSAWRGRPAEPAELRPARTNSATPPACPHRSSSLNGSTSVPLAPRSKVITDRRAGRAGRISRIFASCVPSRRRSRPPLSRAGCTRCVSRGGGIDRHVGGAHEEAGEVRDGPLGTVLREDGDAVARRQPELAESRTGVEHGIPELDVAQALPPLAFLVPQRSGFARERSTASEKSFSVRGSAMVVSAYWN